MLLTLNNYLEKIVTNKIFKTVITLLVVFYILLGSSCSSFASTPVADMSDTSTPLTAERAGNYVANFAINFERNFYKKVEYSVLLNELVSTYNGNAINGDYYFSNSSWIAFVYNQSLKLYDNTAISTMGVGDYVTPHTKIEQATWKEDFFEQIKFNGDAYAVVEDEETGEKKKTEYLNIADLASNDEIHPGDVLIRTKYTEPKEGEEPEPYTGMVVLYIGAGQVIYCEETENGKNVIVKCYIDDLHFTIDTVLRIKEDTANKILDTNATLIFAGQSYDPQITYQGIPGYGTYLGTSTFWDFVKWLVDSIANILDYLVGILTYALRAVIIGWTNLVENLMNYTLVGSREEVNGSYVNSLTGKANNLDSRISIEDIFFNKIPILDVNFFSVEKAGGSEISEDSIVFMLRQNIAYWYYIIRIISIIVMLLILLYVGIRIAMSASGSKKAQYKSAIVGWVVGFIAVITVHLFIYIVFEINEFIVSVFESAALQMNGGELSLYETIRSKSYAPKFTEGFGSTVIYMYLVYLLIRASIIYFKRYLTVTILGLIGPVIGLKYGVERATGRKTKSISTWMFEFSMNVLLQGVHAVLYVALMQIALSMAFESLAGYIVALVILNFMLKADKIFMKIFNFDRSKSVGDTAQQEGFLEQFAKITWGYKLTTSALKKAGKGALGFGAGTIHFAERIGDIVKDREAGETQKIWRRNLVYKPAGFVGRGLNKLTGDRISSIAALSLLRGDEASKKMDKLAIDALKLNMRLTGKTFKRALKATKSSIGSAAKIATALPLTIVDPMAGIAATYSAVSTITNSTDKTAIRNKRFAKEYEKFLEHPDRRKYARHDNDTKVQKALRTAGRTATAPIRGTIKGTKSAVRATGAMASFGAGGIAVTAGYDIDKYEQQRMKNHKLIETLKEADKTKREIEDIYKQLENELAAENRALTKEEQKEKLDLTFASTVKEAQVKRVKSSTVKGAVEEYMSQHNLTYLSELDVDNIMEILKRREGEIGKKLEFDSDVLDNIRDSLRETIEKNTPAKPKRTKVLPSEMQKAFKQGLAKQGSIKPTKKTKPDDERVADLKVKLQERVRQYQNLYESSGKKVDSTASVVSKITEDKANSKKDNK